MVFDEFQSVATKRNGDGNYHYEDVARKQSVVLVRTGNENGLSAPISFESLKDKALPLPRSENMGSIEVTHVPLQIGVRFVATLLLREEAAFPESGRHFSRETDHPFMKWERKAREYREERLALARARDVIEPFMTVEAVKNVVLHNRVDLYSPEDYAPFPFEVNWI